MAAAAATSQVPRCQLAPGLDISRIVTGLWQVADLEREGGLGLDQRAAAEHLRAYAAAGLSSFDMADHYGSAEELIGELVALLGDDAVQTFTKWCPKPGPEMATREAVDEAVRLSAGRMGLLPDHAVGGGGGGGGGIPLLQFHTWDYLDGPGSWLTQLRYLAAHPLVRNLGLTNFDTQHLRVALAEGLPIVSNQVSFSLLDTRAAAPGGMGELCTQRGVAILAFGVLAGGLLTDRWLGTRLGCFRLCTLTEVCLWRGEEWREFLSPQDKAGAADAGQPEPTPAQLASSWSLAKYMCARTSSLIARDRAASAPAAAPAHISQRCAVPTNGRSLGFAGASWTASGAGGCCRSCCRRCAAWQTGTPEATAAGARCRSPT
jgi:aryl-alcohol dehydrogenase-like predicted oxidoreductase